LVKGRALARPSERSERFEPFVRRVIRHPHSQIYKFYD